MSIAENLERVRHEVADACARAHREPAAVALMAVSKVHPAEALVEAFEAGQRLFGENRVQEWQTKSAELAASGKAFGLRTHLIGPLQNKHGVAPELLPELLAGLAAMPALVVKGLMTVPPFSEDAETARPYFQRLRAMRDDHQKIYPTLTELSMGMSNDFRVAIEEGSTAVRIGTAIFGKRVYS
jgi:uncharacterized pyridoxal phosphate-containing UPF0001 family protein